MPAIRTTAARACTALGWLLLLVAMLLLAMLVWLHTQSSTPYVVRSDSMQPTMSAGDLTVARRVDPASIEPGDVITFYQPRIGAIVTHRVTQRSTTSPPTFTTKGDANDTADFEQVRAQDVRGEYWFSIRDAGYAAIALSSPRGRIAIVAVPLTLLLLGSLLGRAPRPRSSRTRLAHASVVQGPMR